MRRFSLILALVFLLSACGPAYIQTPVVMATRTPEQPTPTPLPTRTAIPPTVPPTLEDGDVLTSAQKERLAQISLSFLASTEAEAQQVAEAIGYMTYPSPSNMCGPLSIAELQAAGLLNRYIEPHDFWLLTPDSNADTLRKTFPSDHFENFRFTQSIGDFDFKKFPLKAGDLLYLFAGDAGTFEHILTVTRVDEQGRAYSVTNLNTQPYPNYYYIIREVMLYDPNQPGTGQFYDWTNAEKNNWIGLTGYGGFEVWRFSTPVQEETPEEAMLREKLDGIFRKAGGDWKAIILDAESNHRAYDLHSNDLVHVASVIKVPVAMLVFASLEKTGMPPAQLATYIGSHGDGDLLSVLLHDMLVDSDEKATDLLLTYIRKSGLDIKATLAEWGAADMDVFNRTAPLEQVAKLMAGLYRGEFLSNEARQLILDWMAEYTPSDDTRLGVLRSKLPEGAGIYDKRGSITEERLVIGDAGIITWQAEDGGKVYVVVIFGYPGEIPTNDRKLEEGIEQAALAFWEFAK